MITLYHCMSARSFRPLWMLEELNQPYELILLPFPPRVHARHFLEINPLGTIPAFIHENNLMTESSAICQYLATKFGGNHLAVDAEDKDYGYYLNFLHFGEATLTFPQTIILRYGQFENEDRKLPQVVYDYKKWFLGRLKAVEIALSGSEYLCQNRFTAADISVGYALMLASFIGLETQFTENIADYWNRLKRRTGYLQALEAQEKGANEQGIPIIHAPLIGK